MSCGKAIDEDLNRTRKRAFRIKILRILRNDYSSSFEELLRKSNQ